MGAAKQFAAVGDARVLDRSRATAHAASDGVVVVLPSAADVAAWPTSADEIAVVGGATRSDSVRAGLAAVPAEATVICVHDAARPFATAALFADVIAAVSGGADGAVPGLPVTDTIKVVADGVVTATPDRDSLVAVQTPQAFRAASLRAAHAGGGSVSDDAALVERAGGRVVIVAGDPDNRKLTTPDDLEWARRRVAGNSSSVEAER